MWAWLTSNCPDSDAKDAATSGFRETGGRNRASAQDAKVRTGIDRRKQKSRRIVAEGSHAGLGLRFDVCSDGCWPNRFSLAARAYPAYTPRPMARPRFLFSPFGPTAVPFSFFADRLVKDEEFRGDLKRILALPPQQFAALAEALAAYPTFLNRAALAEIVAEKAPSADHRLLTGIIARLNQMMRDSSDTIEEAFRTLIEEVSEHKDFAGPLAKTLEDRLRAFIVTPRGLAKQKKAESLAEATGCDLSNFAIICDVRPVFDEERKTIEGAVAVTTLRLELQESDGRLTAVECRLTEQQLDRLYKASDAARKKLAAVGDLLESKSVPLAKVQEGTGGQ